jgi:copper chaperone CopZ
MATRGQILMVYCCEDDSNHVINYIPESLQGLASRRVTSEYSSRLITCVYDVEIALDDQFSGALRAELDSNGISYILALLGCQNHLALISVDGMTCNSCVELIEDTLGTSGGVNGIKVSLQGKEAFVQFNPGVINADTIVTAIYDMGFDASIKKVYITGILLKLALAMFIDLYV